MVAVGGTGVTGEHVLHQRRGAPVAGQGEVRPGADHAGLGHAPLLHVRVAQLPFLAIEIVKNKVALVNQRVQVLVDNADVRDGAVIRIAEFIHLLAAGAGAVLLAAAPVELVARGVRDDVPGRVVTALVVHQVDEFVIDRRQGGLGVRIRVVEILIGDDAFLRDVQKLLVAGNEGNERKGADNSENDILFHGCHRFRRKH